MQAFGAEGSWFRDLGAGTKGFVVRFPSPSLTRLAPVRLVSLNFGTI